MHAYDVREALNLNCDFMTPGSGVQSIGSGQYVWPHCENEHVLYLIICSYILSHSWKKN